MQAASYVGDPVTGAAMGLIGIRVFTPGPNAPEIWDAVAEARRTSAVVILDQGCAERIQAQLMAAVVETALPPVVVLPSLDSDEAPAAACSRAARRALGLERGHGR